MVASSLVIVCSVVAPVVSYKLQLFFFSSVVCVSWVCSALPWFTMPWGRR